MTIPIEQLGERLSKVLQGPDEHQAIELTKNADTVAWVVRIPQEIKENPHADLVFDIEEPSGRLMTVHIQAKSQSSAPQRNSATPIFGAGRGTLTIVSEDDEHLKDFQEYMK